MATRRHQPKSRVLMTNLWARQTCIQLLIDHAAGKKARFQMSDTMTLTVLFEGGKLALWRIL
jgi:hypothetical protein